MRIGDYRRAVSIYRNPHLSRLKKYPFRADWMADRFENEPFQGSWIFRSGANDEWRAWSNDDEITPIQVPIGKSGKSEYGSSGFEVQISAPDTRVPDPNRARYGPGLALFWGVIWFQVQKLSNEIHAFWNTLILPSFLAKYGNFLV